VTTPLPPGRIRRGQLLLTGRLHPRDVHPTELAYAVRHILLHPSLEADAFHRSREDVALAELRVTLGDWPRSFFGTAALAALAAGPRPGECVRCRANMLARVRRLPPPGFDAATNFLLGEGCDRCRRRTQPRTARPSGARLTSSVAASPGRPSLARLRAWVDREVMNDRLLRGAVQRLLGDQPIPGDLGLRPMSDDPVHPSMR
jgi:hypothetical protein